MFGTGVNTAAIIVGSIIGLFIKGGLSARLKQIITEALGLAVLFIGFSGALQNMGNPDAHPILFIISLVVGGIIGEGIDIEGKLLGLGKLLERKTSGEEGSVSKGFVTASLVFCVGTMSILGALESGIQGNHNTLLAKSLLDGIASIIFASTFGIGVMLSAISVLIYQGAITLLASTIAPYLTDQMMVEIGIIGGILITGIGLDMLGIKKLKIGNLLPAILIPVVYYIIRRFV